mgnify:FL=1
MSIGREESLFLTVSEDHRKRTCPEYVQKMSEPFERAGGMVEVYEGVVLGGADKFFEKSRRKRLTARRGRDKFPLLRRGEILAARSEKKLRGSKKKLLTSWTERGKFPLRR